MQEKETMVNEVVTRENSNPLLSRTQAMHTDVIRGQIYDMLPVKDMLNLRLVDRVMHESVQPFLEAKKMFHVGEGRNSPGLLLDFLKASADQGCHIVVSGLKFLFVNFGDANFRQLARTYGPTVVRLHIRRHIENEFHSGKAIIKSLLQQYFPTATHVRIECVRSKCRYIDDSYQWWLPIKHLTIDDETGSIADEDYDDQDFTPNGSGLKSLICASDGLITLELGRPSYAEIGLKTAADAGMFKDLRVLKVCSGFNAEVLPNFLQSAKQGHFNRLMQLEIGTLIDCDLERMILFYNFIGLQKDLEVLWVPRYQPVSGCVLTDKNLIRWSTIFNQIVNLASLTTLNITPAFKISILKECQHLHTVIMQEIRRNPGGDNILNHVFGGEDITPLRRIRRLRLNLDKPVLDWRHEQNLANPSGHDCHKKTLDLILRWFPEVDELVVEGIHPNGLTSIWNHCKKTRKLELKITVVEWNFHLNSAITGYSQGYCDAQNDSFVSEIRYANDYDPLGGPSLHHLADLTSFYIEFWADANAMLRETNKDSFKLTDMGINFGVVGHPSLLHFEFGPMPLGQSVCVKMSKSVSSALRNRYFNKEHRMSTWGTLPPPKQMDKFKK